MPEYWVVNVHYDENHSRIKSLKLRRFDTSRKQLLIPPMETSREFLADLIGAEAAVFKTATWNAKTELWSPGEIIHVVGNNFISTNRNEKTKDNLGELPEFTPR